MIAFISGTIISKGKSTLTVMTNAGIGYDIHIPPVRVAEAAIGSPVEYFTYLRVTDSDHSLFGFGSAEEKAFFQLLLSVSGVGPKSAMNILSLGSLDQIRSAIARGDAKYLTAVQGMGKKTAERLIVELKNKVGAVAEEQQQAVSDVIIDVIDGLVALGYSKQEAKIVVMSIESGGKSTEELLRDALKLMK